MTMTTEKTLKQDAAISILFGSPITGFLYGGNVFIELLNDKPSNIYVLNEEDKKDVSTALYLSEMVTNSLGLDLNSDNSFSREFIEEKIQESFQANVFVNDFDVIFEGEEIELVNPFENEAGKNVEEDIKDEVKEIEEETSQVEPIGSTFASALQKHRSSSKENELSNDPVVSEKVELPLQEETPIVASVDPSSLTRDEKREISKKQLLTLFTDENKTYVLSDLYTDLKPLINFETSVSSVRNFLIDLANENKIEVAGRGKFKLASGKQISLFENDTDENLPTQTVPSQTEEPVQQQNVAVQPAPVVQKVKAPVAQTEFVVLKEEHKKATNFSALFDDNDSVKSYLEMLDVPANLTNWVIEYRSYNRQRFADSPQFVVDLIPSDLAYLGSSSVLTKGLAALKSDTPLSLKGPAGTGKTTLIETLAAVLNLPLFSINGSLESNKSTLVGEPTIKQQGVISIKDGQMQKAADFGGILYVDEINMMRPDMLSIVNGFLDHRKTFYNDVRGEMTFAHKDTRFVSAMNVGYSGTKQMNKATSDRKVAIQLSYMTKAELKKVLTKVIQNLEDSKNLSIVEQQKIVEKVTKFYSVVSQKAQNGLVPDLAASTRSIIQLLKHIPIIGYQLSLEMIFDKFTDEEVAQIKGALLGTGLEDEFGVDFSS